MWEKSDTTEDRKWVPSCLSGVLEGESDKKCLTYF